MKRLFTYSICILLAFITNAQDIHFSNFYSNVLNVNPAFAGNFRGKYRISGTFRDQYRTVAMPYQTISLGFDSRMSNVMKLKNTFGYGILCNYDLAGDSYFSTLQCNIPFAQHLMLKNKQTFLSFGIMPSIVFNSIDYTLLRFPDQYDGIQYNPDLLTNENLEISNTNFFNIAAGMLISQKVNKKQTYTMGFAAYNIFSPNMSFLDNHEVKIPQRFMFHGIGIISTKSDVNVLPGFKLQFQGSQKEFHFGAMRIRYFDNIQFQEFSAGLWFRSRDKDALILGIGCNYMGLDIVLNYDVNLSALSIASQGHGAVELTVSTILYDRRKKQKRSSVKCPSYL